METERKMKTKGTMQANKTTKTVWSDDMVVTLLTLRCDDYSSRFELSKSTAQISRLWNKLTLDLNIDNGTNVPVLAVRNKYQALKREYSQIQLSEGATGNEVSVSYPTYWESAVMAFGDKLGLGHHEYSFTGNSDSEPDDNVQDDEEKQSSKRGAEIETEVQRQRAKRNKKMDFVDASQAAYQMNNIANTTDNDTNKLSAAIQSLHYSVEMNTAVQSELLAYLKRNNL
ncbi:hypothetical protein AC1031_019396 [Aphanomyces cochlioides]|nr:hypothetical protein AC1031_019396 [Aphanomyces cochlioides]